MMDEELSLTSFAGDDFELSELINKLCSTTNLMEDDLDFLGETVMGSLNQLQEFSVAVDGRISRLQEVNAKNSSELSELLTKQLERQTLVSKRFRQMEKTFGQSAEVAVGIGGRLKHIDDIQGRSSYARVLLRHYSSFVNDGENPFADMKPTEAAPIMKDIELMVQKGEGEALIENTSDSILKQLLDDFDVAQSDGDVPGMYECAEAVLENFAHKQGPESLFQRFAFHSLSPLALNRQGNVSYKLTAIQEHLALLFGQMRSVVRSQYSIVSRVFPKQSDEVMALLVTRLFNDSLYGLQPMIHNFLHPPHQELSQYEYLQVLSSSHKHSQMLVHELITGLHTSSSTLSTASKRLGRRSSCMVSNEALSKHIRFDSEFIRKQMLSVFRQFTRDYPHRENLLFSQRISKAVHSVLADFLINLSSPDLIKPPFYKENRKKASETARMNSKNVEAYDKLMRNEELKLAEAAKLYPINPVKAVESLMGGSDAAKMVTATFQIPESWEHDMDSMGVDKLWELSSKNIRWNASYIYKMFNRDGNDSEDSEDSEDEEFAQDYGTKSFATVRGSLRGLTGQTLRWAYEAHLRGTDLLKLDKSAKKGLVYHDDNQDYSRYVETCFISLVDHSLSSILNPLAATIVANLPAVTPIKKSDGDVSMLKTFTDDQADQLFSSSEEHDVVGGLDRMKKDMLLLPILASNNTQVKSVSKQISTNHQLLPVSPAAKLFVVAHMEIEEAVENLLLYWKDVVHPCLVDFPNLSSKCQEHLRVKLHLLENILSEGLQRQLQYVAIELQGAALAMHDKYTYNPQADVEYDQTSWSKACCLLLNRYFHSYSFFSNPKIRENALAAIAILTRNVLLGILARSKVSLPGSFFLAQDINAFYRDIVKNPFVASDTEVMASWDALRVISQLFLVQPENLESLVHDGGRSLQLQRRLLYDCVSRRTGK